MKLLEGTSYRIYVLLVIINVVCWLTPNNVFAQSMGISSSAITPDSSAILEIRTTSKGILIPRMTTVERNAISLPATGLMIYNITTNSFNFYNGTIWTDIAGGGGGSGINSLSGSANRIIIGGTSADPSIDISPNYIGQSSINTIGTITSGIWNGTIISPMYGGTGVDNGSKTVTLGGNFTTSGNFTTTLNTTGVTNISLPTTGIISTLSGAETLLNKTLTAPNINAPTGIIKSDVGLGNVDNTSDVGKPVSNATQTALNLKINSAEKGINNGVATLDAAGKVPISQMAVGAQVYKGTWNPSINSPAISDASGLAGDTYRVIALGTVNLGSGNVTFYPNDDAIHNGTIWQRNPAQDAVTTVNGQSGTVILNSDLITEGSTNKYYTDARASLKLNVSDKGINNGVATLDAGGKVPVSQLPVGSQSYKGTWNANTNSPLLADNTGTSGWTYRVTTSGNQDLGSGSIAFSVGDDVIHNGTAWQRSPSAASVSSVNTLTGNIVLNSDNIGEGSTNLYFTNSRTRSVFSVNAPLAYNSTSGVFSVPQATSSLSGYISSTDWTTFNQKQSAFSTSAGLAGILTDETGTGVAVFSQSPTLSTPVLGVASSTSNTITGTAGSGYLELQSQSSVPTSGISNSIRLFSNGTGALAWKRSDGFIRNFASSLTEDRTYTLPDANGTIAVSANGNIALSAAGNISFTGILPVANGGTNSATALNNNRVIVSSGGALGEAAELENGELLIGSTGGAPVAAKLTAGNGIVVSNAAGSITIKNEPTITQATSSTSITTTSTTYVALSTPLTITPGAGDYMVFFNALVGSTKANTQVYFSIYRNGTQITTSEAEGWIMFDNGKGSVQTQAYITGLTAGQAIEVRWKLVNPNSGTASVTTSQLIVQKVK